MSALFAAPRNNRLVREHFTSSGKPKKAYAEAWRAADAAAAHQAAGGSREHPYRAYLCPVCDQFHVGRRPSGGRRDNEVLPGTTAALKGDDRMRAVLTAAGWRRIDNAIEERWLAPGVSGKAKAGRKKTLQQAWAAHRRAAS